MILQLGVTLLAPPNDRITRQIGRIGSGPGLKKPRIPVRNPRDPVVPPRTDTPSLPPRAAEPSLGRKNAPRRETAAPDRIPRREERLPLGLSGIPVRFPVRRLPARHAGIPLRFERFSLGFGGCRPTAGESKGGGGATRLKQHLAGRGTDVVHCEKVSKEVREYFQRDLERTKRLTAQRAQERLRKEKAAAEGNYPGGDEAYDEESELQRALDQSRAEEEFHRGVQERGGSYEHGGGSSTRGEGPLQRMLRRATSARQTPGVTDYNLGSARGSTQPRIDTGSWTQKGKNAKEAIGRAWSKFFHTAGDDDEGDTPLPSNIVADKINPADLRKRKYHVAPSKVVPKRQRGQATGKGKQKEIEVLSGEDTDDVMMAMMAMMVMMGMVAVMVMMEMVVAAVAVLLAVAGAEACHLQTHLLDIDHGAPMSQRRTVGPTDYDSPQFSSSSSYRDSSHLAWSESQTSVRLQPRQIARQPHPSIPPCRAYSTPRTPHRPTGHRHPRQAATTSIHTDPGSTPRAPSGLYRPASDAHDTKLSFHHSRQSPQTLKLAHLPSDQAADRSAMASAYDRTRGRAADEAYDFDEFDPTPFGGGYDLFATFGRPLSPTEETCYPCSEPSTSYDAPHYSASEPSPYGHHAKAKPNYGFRPQQEQQQPSYGGGGGGYGSRPQPAAEEAGGYGSGYGRKNQEENYGSGYGSGYGRKPQAEESYGSGGYGGQARPEGSYGSAVPGSGYGATPPAESYGSGYGRKPQVEESYDSGYGRKPQVEESYGSGYGRKPQVEQSYGSEYGSGYGVKPQVEESYGTEYGSGYGRKPQVEPVYGRPQGAEEYGSGGYGRKTQEESYGSSGYGYGKKTEEQSYGGSGYGYGKKASEDEGAYGSGGYGRPKPYGEETQGYGYGEEKPKYQSGGYERPSYGGGDEYRGSYGRKKDDDDSDEEKKQRHQKHHHHRRHDYDD
ncbi:hypothetical protein HU200_021438 [Digitaria exilis]|uniref:Uncharacterized protein n=1 Tax=Digitaria exilis TaxID=1010633 RepID=A0A835EZ26_9POAL|nr:hypothetical protein HU200_021438 [Digitaria exilis]